MENAGELAGKRRLTVWKPCLEMGHGFGGRIRSLRVAEFGAWTDKIRVLRSPILREG
jgi:hypothetical protein